MSNIAVGLILLAGVFVLAFIAKSLQRLPPEGDDEDEQQRQEAIAIEEAAKFLNRWNQYDAKKAEEAPLPPTEQAIEVKAKQLKRLDSIKRAGFLDEQEPTGVRAAKKRAARKRTTRKKR